MPMFVVIAKGPPETVQAKIDAQFKDSNYKFKDDVWFVQAAMTTDGLADTLGVRLGGNDVAGVVCPITTYSGRANADMWEWLRLRWEK